DPGGPRQGDRDHTGRCRVENHDALRMAWRISKRVRLCKRKRTEFTALLPRFSVMRTASPKSRRTSALPTSRMESLLSNSMPISWLNEQNAHQDKACSRAARFTRSVQSAQYSVRGVSNSFPGNGSQIRSHPGQIQNREDKTCRARLTRTEEDGSKNKK